MSLGWNSRLIVSLGFNASLECAARLERLDYSASSPRVSRLVTFNSG